jgi:hypothetical protein
MGLSLALLFLLGTLKVVHQSHTKIALQSRLDICAVKHALGREQFLRQMARSNKYLRWSIRAVNLARGLRVAGIIFPPAGMAGAMGEQAALRANEFISKYQDANVFGLQGAEAISLPCRATPFSAELAGCYITPLVQRALMREKPLFPDLRGELRWTKPELGKVTCASGITRTRIRISGDLNLSDPDYWDEYEK